MTHTIQQNKLKLEQLINDTKTVVGLDGEEKRGEEAEGREDNR